MSNLLNNFIVQIPCSCAEFIANFSWVIYGFLRGLKSLIHHHLDYGPSAIPIPKSVHGSQPGWGIWHYLHSGG